MNYDEMKQTLINACDEYYNNGNSIITDEEFDNLKDKFKEQYPNDEFLKQIGAPIKSTGWSKEKHNIKMNSLNKINTLDEFIHWSNRINDSSYILMIKCDGCSLELCYNNGYLEKAITQGDSIIGENIFNNVIHMKNVKRYIPGFTGSLRGEIVITGEDFEKINEVQRSNNKKELANPRNSASGISKKFDSEHVKYLSVYHYNATGNWNTEEEKLKWMEQVGIKLCFWKKCNVSECIHMYEEFEKHLRAETEIDIDGLVIRANNINLLNQLGDINGNPLAQIAFKFTSMKVETEIEGIEWSPGQSMRITPVALLKPVKIGGVTIRRATMHNIEVFRSLNLGKGDIVLISRRNDVIPYIESVVEYRSNIKFKPPLYCPMCDEELVEEEKVIECRNSQCRGIRLGNLNKWCDSLEIDGVNEKTIELLERANLVKEPSDFYTLDPAAMSNLERMGDKTIAKIIDSFSKKKEMDLATFIDALNIYNFGKSRAETLINAGYDTIEKMMSVTQKDLIKINKIGDGAADIIVYGLSAKKLTIEKLLKVITIIQPKEIQMSSQNLKGMVMCFTGGINRINPETNKPFKRELMWDMVLENGGKVDKSISKSTTHLVQADPDSKSSKTLKAIEKGITILGEDRFFEMIGK